MHETDPNPTLPSSEPAEGLAASALRAHAWYGEPFLHAGEDPVAALAPGTARRAALDDAIAEMDAGRKTPSNRWRVRYGLMLGLERVLASPNPATASGTDLRRHQIDALAGMLTELIASSQRAAEENGNGNGNGNGHAARAGRRRAGRGGRRLRRRRDRRRARRRDARVQGRGSRRLTPLPLPPPDGLRQDDRRRRVRRVGAAPRRPDPHPSPPARLPVHARPHDRGLRRPLHRRDRHRHGAAAGQPDHDPDLRLVRAPRGRDLAHRVPARDLRRGPHGARREDERSDPVVQRADLHRHDGDGAADREAGLGRVPGLGRRPPAGRRRPPRPDRTAAVPPGAARCGDQLGADRRRRLRGARPRGSARPLRPQPGSREPLPRALRHDARHRLRGRRRARLQPRAGVPRRRHQGRGRLGQDAAGEARRDARRLRARRDQRAHQRPAPRRGLELASRDGLLPPRADRLAPRLPAAHRPDHAHALAQGSRHRRRLRDQGLDAQRPRDLAPLAARRGLLPRGGPGHARPRVAASSGGRAGSSRRLRGSFRSRPTSRAGSP